MGVPGFFLWLQKNYKNDNFVFNKNKITIKEINDSMSDFRKEELKNENVKHKQILDDINSIDYFLIDTNCLIHPMCFKILAENPDLTDNEKLESKMINQVMLYINELVDYVKPKKGVFIAIDGVAPVAKIKQQRSRRYKSVHDKELWDSIKKKHKKPLSNFWNNSAITPGTEFMKKLHYKIIDWAKTQKVQIIYSSCNTPSEGEHKLLQFIRNNQKDKKNYKYVLYGLDADLIFLALSTNNNDVYLLREANQINKNEPENTLSYVSIRIMRNCIFNTIDRYYKKQFLQNDKSYEKFKTQFISDFIFLCYFLGNDFLPHLPSLNIQKDGIEYLIDAYSEILFELTTDDNLPSLISDINKMIFNEDFLKKLIKKLSQNEEAILLENYAEKKKYHRCDSTDKYDQEIFKIENLQFKINDPVQLGSDNHKEWRKRYYKHYFGCKSDESLEDFSEKIVKNYLMGIKWVSIYYFDKCGSWDWYYPYDQPPFLSDIAKYIDKIHINNITFKLGKPLKPFVQLLCVLPQQSNYLLPPPLRKIMVNPHSSLSHLYPTDFEQDFLNKHKYWMAIPQLPPLEVELIKYVYHKYQDELSKDEQWRNRIEDDYIFNNI